MATPRIYLTGRIAVENGACLLNEHELVGRQGRLAFAYLITERHHPVAKEQLSSVIWPDGRPHETEVALSAILSKLRAVLKRVDLSDTASIDVLSGSVHLRLPSDVWIDVEHASNSIDEADGSWRAGQAGAAWGQALATVVIARRSFLPGEEAPWIEARRAKMRTLLVRGLHVLSMVSARNNETALALQYATEIVDLEPFQETGYRHLMRLHADMGNRGEALRVFGRCRELFRDELGADPSQETERVFLEILRAGN